MFLPTCLIFYDLNLIRAAWASMTVTPFWWDVAFRALSCSFEIQFYFVWYQDSWLLLSICIFLSIILLIHLFWTFRDYSVLECWKINWGILKNWRVYLCKIQFKLGSIQFSKKHQEAVQNKKCRQRECKWGSYTRQKSGPVIERSLSFRR